MSEARNYLQEEVVPLVLRKALELLEDERVRPSIKANLIINLLKMALDSNQARGNEELERRHAMAFLKEQGVQFTQIDQIIVHGQQVASAEYLERFRALMPKVMEGEVRELPEESRLSP
jgi:hypothetical protein